MPEGVAHVHAWRAALTRGLVASLALTLLLSLLGFTPAGAAADLTGQIAAARRSQIYHESVMRAQDRQLQRLSRAHKHARRALRKATRHLKDVQSRRAATRQRVRARTKRLEHIRAKWPPDATGGEEEEEKEPSKVYLERLEQARDQLAGARRSLRRVERRAARVYRAKKARQRRVGSIRRQIRVAASRQRSAEASLGGQIVSMTRLAQQRATQQTGLRLGAGGDSFAWPAFGSITQRYGCTGFYLNPRRGSCRHFHDGIDMSPNGGTAIRSVAAGVVAYVGWNPWDSEGRAFIVVIGHPDGFHSRYGHLQPARQVRVGQLVSKGQTIGRMGSTGMSTGVHLHMELLDRSGTVDPLAYLPPREIDQKAPARSSRGRDGDRSARAGKAGEKKKSASQKKRSASQNRSASKKKPANKGKSASRRKSGDARKAGARGKRDGGGKRRDRGRDAPAAEDALDLDAAQEGPTPPWSLTWPAGCQPASETRPAPRDRAAVAGQVDGSRAEPATRSEPGCQGASFEGALDLSEPEGGDDDEGEPPTSLQLREASTAR